MTDTQDTVQKRFDKIRLAGAAAPRRQHRREVPVIAAAEVTDVLTVARYEQGRTLRAAAGRLQLAADAAGRDRQGRAHRPGWVSSGGHRDPGVNAGYTRLSDKRLTDTVMGLEY